MSAGTGAGFAAFEAAVDRALGDRLRSDDAACRAMWSALANTEWTHADGSIAGHTFRPASEVAATIRGRGRILEWSCCGHDAVVSGEIEEAMAREGWTHGAIP